MSRTPSTRTSAGLPLHPRFTLSHKQKIPMNYTLSQPMFLIAAAYAFGVLSKPFFELMLLAIDLLSSLGVI